MPTAQSVHIDRALSDFSIGIIQEPNRRVAGDFFPITETDHKSDKYHILDRNPFARGDAKPRGPNEESAGFEFTLSDDSFAVKEFALHTDVPAQTLANADPQARRLIEEARTRLVTENILLTHEVEWTTKYFTTGVWGTDEVGGTAFPRWDDYANSDPVKDVDRARRAIIIDGGKVPNAILVGYDVWTALKNHPFFVDRIKHVSDQAISQDIVARFLEVDKLIVASAVKATNAVGAAATYDFVLGKNALLAHVGPAGSGEFMASAGRIFAWRGTGGPGANMVAAVSVIDRPLHKSVRYEVEMNWDDKVTGAQLGYFFSLAVD